MCISQDIDGHQIFVDCYTANPFTMDELSQLANTDDISKFNPSNNMMCFLKCLADKYQMIKDNKLDVEQMVKLFTNFLNDAATIRAIIEKCKPVFKGDGSCKEVWSMFVCINQQIDWCILHKKTQMAGLLQPWLILCSLKKKIF